MHILSPITGLMLAKVKICKREFIVTESSSRFGMTIYISQRMPLVRGRTELSHNRLRVLIKKGLMMQF